MSPVDQIKAIQNILGVSVDGVWGDLSDTAFRNFIKSENQDRQKIAAIQSVIGVKADGIWGPLSQGALLQITHPSHPLNTGNPDVHFVMASSFADPSDVAAYRRCRAQGKSDQQCFRVGDNGIGKWGDDCTGPTPMCALPPEDWEQFGEQARGKKVVVTVAGHDPVVCELRDTMPHRAHITNGAGIDLSPGAVKALGLTPPIMVHATWAWA